MTLFHTPTRLGEHMGRTPEGFLICYDVPLARTGMQTYAAKEVYLPEKMPANLRPTDPVRVDRPESEVFDPLAIASAQGKILVDEHPEENGLKIDVTPQNWRRLAMGHIINPHRGQGPYSDLLLGDLVVTAEEAIQAVLSGKRELSCGYDAVYSPVAHGHLEQRNIRINHVALVDNGRCGARCAIRDDNKESQMAEKSWLTRLKLAFTTRDENAFLEAVRDAEESAPENHMHVHLEPGIGGGPGAKEVEDMHTDEEKHGSTHSPGGEDPIPGLTKRIDRIEDSVNDIRDMVRDSLSARDKRSHDEGKEEREEKERDRRRDANDARRDTRDARKRSHDAIDAMDCSDSVKRRLHDAVDAEEEESREEKEERKDRDVADEPPFEMEAPVGTGDKARKARDSRYFEESFEETVALAEILSPGISMPVFDSAARPKKTFDQLCQFRRKVLDRAWNDLSTRDVIEPVFKGDASKMTCEAIRTTFLAAAALKRQHNNAAAQRTTDSVGSGPLRPVGGPIKTIADYNRAKNEKWAQITPKV